MVGPVCQKPCAPDGFLRVPEGDAGERVVAVQEGFSVYPDPAVFLQGPAKAVATLGDGFHAVTFRDGTVTDFPDGRGHSAPARAVAEGDSPQVPAERLDLPVRLPEDDLQAVPLQPDPVPGLGDGDAAGGTGDDPSGDVRRRGKVPGPGVDFPSERVECREADVIVVLPVRRQRKADRLLPSGRYAGGGDGALPFLQGGEFQRPVIAGKTDPEGTGGEVREVISVFQLHGAVEGIGGGDGDRRPDLPDGVETAFLFQVRPQDAVRGVVPLYVDGILQVVADYALVGEVP